MEYQEWIRYKENVTNRIENLEEDKKRYAHNPKKLENLEKLISHNLDMQKYLDYIGQHWLRQ